MFAVEFRSAKWSLYLVKLDNNHDNGVMMTLLVLQSFLLSVQIECRKNCIMQQTQVHVLEGKYLKKSLIRLFRIRLESLDFRLQKRCFTTIEKSVLNCIDVVSVDSLQSYRGLLIA